MKFISFEKSVGAVIVRFENETPLYLLLKYRSGQWDLPKGHMEKGEKEEDTLQREVQEETGLRDIERALGFRKSSFYAYRAKGNELKERREEGRGIFIGKKAVYYLTVTDTEKVTLDHENSAYSWSNIEQALQKVRAKGTRRILQKAHLFISRKGKEGFFSDVLPHKKR
ncbi:MAG TPA: NUDIX domain-containing protein [Candidatus Moranbacteria bacterium]|nr:NUDIX domain-containing protein [Candidatus Moranbacteria bacterium]